MLETLVAAGYGWANVHVRTILSHAKRIIETNADRDHRYISASGTNLLIDQLLLEAGLEETDLMRSAGASIARTIRDLRNARSSPDTYHSIGTSAYRRTVARVYSDYLAYLKSNHILDDAGIYERAVSALASSEPIQRGSTIIMLDEVELSDASLAFVRSLQKTARSVYRIGQDDSRGDSPANVAQTHLRDWPRPPVIHSAQETIRNTEGDASSDQVRSGFLDGQSEKVDIISAVGAENEIRAVFRRIVREDARLDQIELAYTANQPYLSIVRSLAKRYDVPITIAAGIPALSTRVGQAVRLFLVWISGGCDSQQLAEMIRGGFVEPGSFCENGSSLALDASEILKSVRIRKGAGAYEAVFQTMIASAADRGKVLFGGRATQAENVLEEVWQALNPLLKLADVAALTTIRELNDRIHAFLSQFVVRKSKTSSGTETTARESDSETEDFDPIVAKDLTTRFGQLGEVVSGKLPLQLIAFRMQDLLKEAFVSARAARPGALHVVPLSSAGYNGRPRLYVVGLDELTMGRSTGEDPLLADSDRQELTQATGHRIGLSGDFVRLRSWSFNRAIERARGRITLVYSRYDVAEDRTLFPSSIVLQVAGALNPDDLVVAPDSWIEASGDGVGVAPLDVSDAFLAAGGGDDAANAVADRFPWIDRGIRARAGRASTVWTEYDGVLGMEGSRLDPFGGNVRISASRLETMASCPFRYFIRYVLHVDAPDVLDEDQWLSALERGLLVHRVFAQFMDERCELGESVTEAHYPLLENAFQDELDLLLEVREPSNPAEYETQRRELFATAKAFLADELGRQRLAQPVAFEFGFGVRPAQRKKASDRTEEVIVDMDGLKVSMIGWVDRIDRLASGGLAITDYKTGGSGRFDAVDLLNKGRSLQWALYAYAVQDVLGEPVSLSGYLFPNSSEMGRRLEADPTLVRSEIAGDLKQQARMTRSSSFIPSPEDRGVCSFCEFRTICGDIPELELFVGEKIRQTDRQDACFDVLEHWRYAQKKLGAGT